MRWAIMAAFVLCFGEAHALVADLSTDTITIRSDFTGEKILLFGAIDRDDASDVVIVIRGPDADVTVRRKEYLNGIWINRRALTLTGLPAFYAAASARPLAEIASQADHKALEIGAAHLRYGVRNGTDTDREFFNGFLRSKIRAGLYGEDPNAVAIIGQRLFRAEITLPPGVPVGDYGIDFYLFRDGGIVAQHTQHLRVDVSGVEHLVRRGAHEQPLLYGLGGVLLAGLMGWGGATLFRRV